jgi:ribokinase
MLLYHGANLMMMQNPNAMKTLNFGSICIDNVYQVPHFVRPGETLSCSNYETHPGGKGLNQSLALAYAGADTWHAGKIGDEGIWLKMLLAEAGVETSLIDITSTPTGHAVIQVTPEGENAIVISAGANRTIDHADINQILSGFSAGDNLLLQNEINLLPEIIESAHARNMRIIFNAAPITGQVNDYPLDLVDLLIVNEIEGEALSGRQQPEEILSELLHKFPGMEVVLTLGEQGVVYGYGDVVLKQKATPVTAVDSTGAGDTFTGYFVANWQAGVPVQKCLEVACYAASLCVTRTGAASSIPKRRELND